MNGCGCMPPSSRTPGPVAVSICRIWIPSVFKRFIDELSRTYADDFLLLVMDQAGSHRSETMVWPEHIQPLLLPPYSPELNPVERWFEALRATLSNQLFATIDALDQALTQALQPYWEHTERLVQLTRFTWWRKATANIRTYD